MSDRSKAGRVGEAAAVGIAGGGLAFALGLLLGAPIVLGAIGGINGLVSGYGGIYRWRSGRGWVAFAVDSSWALIGTAIALLLHGAQLFRRGSRYRFDLSARTNVHVYEYGFSLKPGYAFSVGNVVSNAGGRVSLDDSEAGKRRWRFIVNHEFLHVFQNRLFGPTFQLAYVGWMAFGALWGLVAWLRDRRDLGRLIETAAYFNNPFEYWAYVRDDYWPPRDAHPRLVWGARRVTRSPKSR